MNKTIAPVLFSAILISTIVAGGCGQAAPSAYSEAEPQPTEQQALRTFEPGDDERLLDELRQATQGIIAHHQMARQPVPNEVLAALQSIEDAGQVLRELQVDRQAVLTGINHCRMLAQPVPDELAAALQQNELARDAVLISLGLGD